MLNDLYFIVFIKGKRRKKGVKKRKLLGEKNLKNGTKKHIKKEKRIVRTKSNNDKGVDGEEDLDLDYDVTGMYIVLNGLLNANLLLYLIL